MKKSLSILTVLFSVLSLQATVWRVNNLPGTDAEFTTLQQAHDAPYVYDGDTLYLEASAGTYGNLTATKKLVLLGNGYFLSENEETQANVNSSKAGTITFNSGSEGSVISGCHIYRIYLNTSDILIERNFIEYDNGGSTSSGAVYFGENNINNIIIRNNYISSSFTLSTGWAYAINSRITGINNILIKGNFILMATTNTRHSAIYTTSGFSGTIENNIIFGNMELFNSTFNNNILRDGSFTQSNGSYHNNLGNSTQFGTTNGNQQNVYMEHVFVGEDGSTTDGQWQLKAGSPAIGAGVGGVDCGMFGGEFPYKLSGLPGIPAIYHLEQIIDNVNQVLNVTIKAKSHD